MYVSVSVCVLVCAVHPRVKLPAQHVHPQALINIDLRFIGSRLTACRETDGRNAGCFLQS